MALSGVVIRGIYSHIAIIDNKIPLLTTTYLIISLEPIVVLPQKFYQQWTITQLIFTKKFKEFEAALFEILRIRVFNGAFLDLN